MAEDCGGWRRTCSEVMSGKVVSLPESMAAHHVERAGENRAAWT
jgi:hypothetical protein